ncbi:hypothetical protein AAC387_Pa07g0104 [Persea americana]
MQENVLRVEKVLQNRMNGSDRSTQILPIERDGNVDHGRIADGRFSHPRTPAFVCIAEGLGFPKSEAARIING